MNFQALHQKICQNVEEGLIQSFNHLQKMPSTATQKFRIETAVEPQLLAAMQYACLGGGKRVRALLVYMSAIFSRLFTYALDAKNFDYSLDINTCLEGVLNQILAKRAANALEMIHAYSLIHDDLPCMDDDDMRRGKPSVHKAFDEATALLAGDALQTQAFIELSKSTPHHLIFAQQKMMNILSNSSGIHGMCGGQSFDLQATAQSFQELSLEKLETIHHLKTGALIRASISLGFISHLSYDYTLIQVNHAAAPPFALAASNHLWQIHESSGFAKLGEEAQYFFDLLNQLGETIGLGFQVTDDILDITQDSSTLGKTAGKDQAQDKYTYIKALGLNQAKIYAAQLKNQAHELVALLFAKLDETFYLYNFTDPSPSKKSFKANVNVEFKTTANITLNLYQGVIEYIFSRKH